LKRSTLTYAALMNETSSSRGNASANIPGLRLAVFRVPKCPMAGLWLERCILFLACET
jgi:hypothetical protein